MEVIYTNGSYRMFDDFIREAKNSCQAEAKAVAEVLEGALEEREAAGTDPAEAALVGHEFIGWGSALLAAAKSAAEKPIPLTVRLERFDESSLQRILEGDDEYRDLARHPLEALLKNKMTTASLREWSEAMDYLEVRYAKETIKGVVWDDSPSVECADDASNWRIPSPEHRADLETVAKIHDLLVAAIYSRPELQRSKV